MPPIGEGVFVVMRTGGVSLSYQCRALLEGGARASGKITMVVISPLTLSLIQRTK
jgi:superfamily II DNA helicase RecQ